MNRLACRLAASLLTFTLGLASASLGLRAPSYVPAPVPAPRGELLAYRCGHEAASGLDAAALTREGDRLLDLGCFQGAGDGELIFDPTRTGRRRRQMLYRFKAAAERAGLPDFHYHDLRHTFATRLWAAGVHEYDIADLLGHSTTGRDTRGTVVTRGYAHAVPSRLREAVERLCTSNVVEFRR